MYLTWTGLMLAASLCVVAQLELFVAITPIGFVAADFNGTGLLVGTENGHDEFESHEGVGLLFGMQTERVEDGALLDKWSQVQRAISKDFEFIKECRAGKACPAPVQTLLDLSLEGIGKGERTRVGLINRAVDLAIRPVSDERQWGVLDHWSSPLETLHSNSGDCEDYAIVKYAALLAAGLSRDAVKIVVLRNRLPDDDHAVVAAWVDHQWLILDNRTLTLVRDTDVRRAIPEFVLDYNGVRRFVRSSPIGKTTS